MTPPAYFIAFFGPHASTGDTQLAGIAEQYFLAATAGAAY
jgi:hypothetical protein